MFKDNFNSFYKATLQLFKIYLLGVFIFTCFRTALLLSFGRFSELRAFKLDLLHAYWVGFRFDTTILTYGFALLFLLNLLILVIPHSAGKYYTALRKFAFWYVLLTFFVFLVILIADYFYFMFFQAHLNKLLFGLAEGDTIAVLTSVWTDYQVGYVVLVIAGICLALAYPVKKIFKREYEVGNKSMPFKIAFVIFLIGVYVIALRGSVGPVPISAEEDALISTNLFLNDLTVNGVFSLKEAFAERRRIAADTPEAAGYTAPEGQQSLERASLTLPAYSRRELQDLLLAKTPPSEFLKKNPPHVVFLQVESLSNYYLDLHSPTLNLLGSLEKQLPDCIVFRNFLSSGNGTIKSLEALMVNNPKGFLFEAHSAFLENSLSSSAALPFLKAGYHTSFITGGDLGFYQMGKFIPKQYFQTVEGSETLLAEIKNAEAGTWGVHDEFLFERIFSKLEQSKGKPQFIYAMTISNHTPFDLPKGYKPYPVQIPSELLKAIKTNEAIAVKNFTAYQYGADCLGRFLERLRRSPYADNTIVVATGDHNTLQLFNFSYTELLQKLSVPLIMYVPKKYLPPGDINTKRFGSHKDIFPTIYYLSLPGATYLKSGDNLLDPALSSTDLFAINDSSVAMNRYGCVLVQKKPLYYKWQKDHPNLLEPTTRLRTPELAHLLSEAQAYVSSLSAYIQSDLGK